MDEASWFSFDTPGSTTAGFLLLSMPFLFLFEVISFTGLEWILLAWFEASLLLLGGFCVFD